MFGLRVPCQCLRGSQAHKEHYVEGQMTDMVKSKFEMRLVYKSVFEHLHFFFLLCVSEEDTVQGAGCLLLYKSLRLLYKGF